MARQGLDRHAAAATLASDGDPTLEYWQPQAVVADTAGGAGLTRYLESILGQPTIRYGTMLGWQR